MACQYSVLSARVNSDAIRIASRQYHRLSAYPVGYPSANQHHNIFTIAMTDIAIPICPADKSNKSCEISGSIWFLDPLFVKEMEKKTKLIKTKFEFNRSDLITLELDVCVDILEALSEFRMLEVWFQVSVNVPQRGK